MPRYSNYKFKYKKYQNLNKYFVLNLFINRLMHSGKKNTAIFVLKKVFLLLSQKNNLQKPYIIFIKCLYNLAPKLKIRALSINNSLVYFAEKYNFIDAIKSSITLLLNTSRKKKGRNFVNKLTNEIIEEYNFKGLIIRKRQEKDISLINKIKFSSKQLNFN
jgi:ribosomal protein S7